MRNEEFTIKSLDFPLRIKSISGIRVLAILSMPTKTMEQNEEYIKTILEATEVKIADKWLPVKEEGVEVYYPDGIEDNIPAINEIGAYFNGKFLTSVFQKSKESKA